MRCGDYVYTFGDFKFYLELDTGGDPDFPYTVWIDQKSNGQPLLRKDNRQARREFPKNYNKIHMKNFCKKFANNDEYRSQYLGQ